MTGRRQAWLVARREVRERSRSRGMWAGTAAMLLFVIAAITVPALVSTGAVTRDVGYTGGTPGALVRVVAEHGDIVDITVRAHHYANVDEGEQAVRDERLDVLVVDARRLVWRGDVDDELRAVVAGAVQMVVVQERADAAGITPDQLTAIASPVVIQDEELGIAEGRSEDDETAAYITSVLLLVALATYGQLVLTGVVQEKSSRVVEVLLARMPARSLLAGKVAGIGFIGFAQFAVTALAALAAALAVDSVDLPAISAQVLAWVVVWFILGYALYATAYGALGSLASRAEDGSSIAAPVSTLLIGAYWAAFVAVADSPDGGWARLVSYVPLTAPFAMPGRVALGVADWWEPLVAAGLTVAALGGLVVLAGRVYSGAILRTGATVKLRDAWGGTASAGAPAGARPRMRMHHWQVGGGRSRAERS